MRILIAIHHFPPQYIGGAEWEAYRTAQNLLSRGHEVRVICVEEMNATTTKNITWHDDLQDEIPVRRLFLNRAQFPDRDLWEYRNYWIAEQLQLLIDEFNPDLFHLFGGYLISGQSLLAAKEAGIPTIVTLLDFWFLCRRFSLLRSDGTLSPLPIQAKACVRCIGEETHRNRWFGEHFPGMANLYWKNHKDKITYFEQRQKFLLERLNQVDLILSRSNFLLSKHVEGGVDPGKIKFFRQGINLKQLQEKDLSKTPSNHLRIGYLGQLSWHKGIHTLLEAIQKMPSSPLTVHIYGNPNAFPEYYRSLQKYTADSRIVFEGVKPQSELTEVFKQLDILVVPSLWYENSPNTIMEAFAHKTPVVTSNLGGMAELVQHENNGLLFMPGDSSDLANQLARLINEPNLLDKLSYNILPVRSISQEMDELEVIYQELLHTKIQNI